MPTEFPYVEIPEELAHIIGERDKGTHIYRATGPEEHISAWFDALTELIGPSVSPGGVCMMCPVSRAAVYKRVNEGKLSMFLYHPTERKTRFFGTGKTVVRQTPYALIPDSEIKAWRKELEERALHQGKITTEELEGLRPDWDGSFMEWKKRKKGGHQ